MILDLTDHPGLQVPAFADEYAGLLSMRRRIMDERHKQ